MKFSFVVVRSLVLGGYITAYSLFLQNKGNNKARIKGRRKRTRLYFFFPRGLQFFCSFSLRFLKKGVTPQNKTRSVRRKKKHLKRSDATFRLSPDRYSVRNGSFNWSSYFFEESEEGRPATVTRAGTMREKRNRGFGRNARLDAFRSCCFVFCPGGVICFHGETKVDSALMAGRAASCAGCCSLYP